MNKYTILIIGIVFDIIGMASFSIPFIGELSDIIWAPFSALILFKMYKGAEGKVGGILTFVEELVPGLDVIPSFTIMWVYKYIIKKQNE